MSKKVKRLGVLTGIDIGDWVYCPMKENATTQVSTCRGCDFFERYTWQDKDNPFNHKTVVECSYEKED